MNTYQAKKIDVDVLVVGGGPGGYVAAIRAGQLGLKTALVEAGDLGGTCLIRGCIPSKAMIHVAEKYAEMCRHAGEAQSGKSLMGISLKQTPEFNLTEAVDWQQGIVSRLSGGVSSLLKKSKVTVIKGWAEFIDAKHCRVHPSENSDAVEDSEKEGGLTEIHADKVILATGSREASLPLAGAERVINSTQALLLRELPKNLVVIGAGYIGLELGMAFAKMGSNVTFVEAGHKILPAFDDALSKPLLKKLKAVNIGLYLDSKAESVSEEGLVIKTANNETQTLQADKILMAVGRKPLTENWGLENLQLERNGLFVAVNQRCETSMKGVYAIGDLAGEPMLAHKASAQGEMVAEIIAGKKRVFEPRIIPAVVFTDPEIVSAGLSPDEAKSQGYDIVTGQFPFMANGRALSADAGADGGFIRVTARKDNHLILGIHAVGKHVSELSGEFVTAIEMGARLEDIAGTIHVHPTMTEAFHEASLQALGHAIHI